MPDADASLKDYAKLLKLPTFVNIDEAVKQFDASGSLEDFARLLLKREYEARQANQQQRRIKSAHFPQVKTLEEFDMTRLEHVRPAVVKELAGCGFIKRHENVIMVGTPGTGKTHLMTAIGVKACLRGMRVLFKNAGMLATELREARDDYHLQTMLKGIARADLLLLDELSYAKFDQEESELLFKVIAERSERASTMITTNVGFSHWTDMFANDTLTAALVDRLTFHAHMLNMNGASYRLGSALKEQRQS